MDEIKNTEESLKFISGKFYYQTKLHDNVSSMPYIFNDGSFTRYIVFNPMYIACYYNFADADSFKKEVRQYRLSSLHPEQLLDILRPIHHRASEIIRKYNEELFPILESTDTYKGEKKYQIEGKFSIKKGGSWIAFSDANFEKENPNLYWNKDLADYACEICNFLNNEFFKEKIFSTPDKNVERLNDYNDVPPGIFLKDANINIKFKGNGHIKIIATNKDYAKEYDSLSYLNDLLEMHYIVINSIKNPVDKYDRALYTKRDIIHQIQEFQEGIKEISIQPINVDYSHLLAKIDSTCEMLKFKVENIEIKRRIYFWRDIRWWGGLLAGLIAASVGLATIYSIWLKHK